MFLYINKNLYVRDSEPSIIKEAIGLSKAGPLKSLATLVSYPSRGFFYPRHSIRCRGRYKPKRTGKNRRGLRALPLSLLSLKPLLYYQNMDAGVLIPIAFLLAGSVAIILSVYMVR